MSAPTTATQELQRHTFLETFGHTRRIAAYGIHLALLLKKWYNEKYWRQWMNQCVRGQREGIYHTRAKNLIYEQASGRVGTADTFPLNPFRVGT